jgi:two-component system OmpR family sensor kinase
MTAGSLRLRMMLLFCFVVGILLAGSNLGYYALLQREVHAQLDRQLQGAAGPVLRDLISEPNSQDINQLNLSDEYFELIDASGRVMQRSTNLQQHQLGLDQLPGHSSQTTFRTMVDKTRGTLRVCFIPFQRSAETFFLVVAMPTDDAERTLAGFRRVTLVLMSVSLLLTAIISTWYVGRSLRPIADLTNHAALMTRRVSDPQRREDWPRLPIKSPRDELGLLAGTFNELLANVDSALGQLRQFVTDASHELRTPLSILQVETELLLAEPELPEKYGKTLAVIHDELRKLSRIVDSLFTLSMADAGQLRLSTEFVYLNEVLEETCVLADQIARPKHIIIERQLGQEIPYFGDEAFLRELFLIFLENAIKYSVQNTTVCVQVEKTDGLVQVRFQDQGIGIAREHLPHIFERFYRVVQNGSGEARSGGLGLAIAQVIVRSHDGSIKCESSPGVGSTFTVDLPSSAELSQVVSDE